MITRVLLATLTLTTAAQASGFSISGQSTRYGTSFSLITERAAAWSTLNGTLPRLNGSAQAITIRPVRAQAGDPMCHSPIPDRRPTFTLGVYTYTLTDFGVAERKADTCHLILPTQNLTGVTLSGEAGTLRITASSGSATTIWYFHPGTRTLALTVAEAHLPAPAPSADAPASAPAPASTPSAATAAPARAAPATGPRVNPLASPWPVPAPTRTSPATIVRTSRPGSAAVNVAAQLDGKLTRLPQPTGEAATLFDNTTRDATSRTCRPGSLELSTRPWTASLAEYASATERVFGAAGSSFDVISSAGDTAGGTEMWHVLLRERGSGDTVYVGLLQPDARNLGLYACRLN